MARKTADDLRKMVFARMDASRRLVDSYEDGWDEAYQQYRSYTEARDDNKANLFIPYTFAMVETQTARVLRGLFEHQPPLTVSPRNPESERNAPAMESLVAYQADRMGLQTRLEPWLKDIGIYGTAYAKVDWRRKVRMVKQRKMGLKPIVVMGRVVAQVPWMIEVEAEEVVWNGPWVRRVDINNLFPDPAAEDVDDARYVIERAWVPLSVLADRAKQGRYDEAQVAKLRDTLSMANQERPAQRRLGSIGLSGDAGDSDTFDPLVELWEYWEDGDTATLADQQIILDPERRGNPFAHGRKPFVKCNARSIGGEWYGLGVPEILESLQEEINTGRNQRLDNVSAIINNMMAVDQTKLVDGADFTYRPNGIVPFRGSPREAIMPLAPSGLVAAGYQEEQLIRQDMQLATQIFDYSMGMAPGHAETATGIMSLQNAGQIVFEDLIRRVAYDGLRKIGQLWLALNQQFITEPQVIRVEGPQGREWRTYKPEDILGEFDLQAAASASDGAQNRDMRRKQMVDFVAAVSTNPLLIQQYDWREVAKLLADQFDIPGREKLLLQQPAVPGAPLGAPPGGMMPGAPSQAPDLAPGGGGLG